MQFTRCSASRTRWTIGITSANARVATSATTRTWTAPRMLASRSGPTQDEVRRPAAGDVRAWPPQVPEQGLVRATALFERVRQDGDVLPPPLVNHPGQLHDRAPGPFEPTALDGGASEGVAEQLAQERGLPFPVGVG